MESTTTNNTTFNMGITMAGAGSAGCYIGGTMDYLFEILDLWERAKKNEVPELKEFAALIPGHNVVIDVMGGTSAGGMTTCMAALYALKGTIKPITAEPKTIKGKQDNIFYDSWVLLDDDQIPGGKATLAKALALDDLEGNKFLSLINSKIIDDIADNALSATGNYQQQFQKLPPYISPNLDILQVHTMLRGIPLAISFPAAEDEVNGIDTPPSHNSFEHFMVSHYKFNNGFDPGSSDIGALWFNPYDATCAKKIALTTKCTGAFPVGLRFREIDNSTFSDAYLKCNTEWTVFNRLGKTKDDAGEHITKKLEHNSGRLPRGGMGLVDFGKDTITDVKKEGINFLGKNYAIDWTNFPPNFRFATIDGGAVNNEPFGEVYGILKSRYGDCYQDGYPKYGIVMIDPFPDVVKKSQPYEMPKDLFGAIPQIVNSLYEQSKVKKDDLLEASEHPYFRGEIVPTRYYDNKKDDFPIASASVGAFGGFLDIKFRHYDFFLGRDNARKYYREYFVLEYNPKDGIIHPIHAIWTEEMVAVFQVTRKGKTYLPIIPDLNLLLNRNKLEPEPEYSISDKPVYDPIQLFNLRLAMEDRVEKILDVCKLTLTVKREQTERTDIAKWMDKCYHKTQWDNFKGWAIQKLFNWVFAMSKGGLARTITEMTVKWVLADLDKRGFLKKPVSKDV